MFCALQEAAARAAAPQAGGLRATRRAVCARDSRRLCRLLTRASPGGGGVVREAACGDPARDAADRLAQLESRLLLRRLYSKLLLSQQLLQRADEAAPAGEGAEGGGEDQAGLDPEEERLLACVARTEAAEQLAAGMQTALAQLRERNLSLVFGAEAPGVDVALRQRVARDFEALTRLAADSLASLPFPASRSLEEARAAAQLVAARVGRGPQGGGGGALKAELELLREQPLEVLQELAVYSRSVWARLNGRDARPGAWPEGLPPLPPPARRPRAALALDVEAADAALTQASRDREEKLKRRDAAAVRLPLAREVRELDAAVRDARTLLAVRTLQLECERVFAALEEEAAEAGDASQAPRDADLALFVAQFGALDAALARVVGLVSRCEEAALLSDDEVDALVRDFGELKSRLGLAEEGVEQSLGLVVEKCARSARDAGSKVTEGAEFLLRGFRLLGEDVSGSLSLVSRTLSGSTLKPREVQTLRRTSRDVLTFIPFIVVLIAPITPVGHVMVFSFLQRYFPGFFPSQFTVRRQELFAKYEELRSQLSAAEEDAGAATEAAALRRAREVVASLSRGGGGGESLPPAEQQRLLRLQSEEQATRRAALGAPNEEQ